MKRADKFRIACVDDEENLRETLAFALKKAGYEVRTFTDGAEAWESMQETLPDLTVIDVMMPKMDGLELCRRLRGLSETLPIIFLTSKDDEIDRIIGLELGADDYLCKPFSMRELLTRIKVIFRRIEIYREELTTGADNRGVKKECLLRGPLAMDTDRFTVTWRERPVPLTVTEYRILHSLAEEVGVVRDREQLLRAAFPEDLYVSDRAVDSHIKRIRKKMQSIDPDFACIDSIYGLGYKFIPPAN